MSKTPHPRAGSTSYYEDEKKLPYACKYMNYIDFFQIY